MSADPEIEQALVSDRLCRIEERLEEVEDLARSSDGRLAQLVDLAQRRDAREEEALHVEIERRKASQEAEAKRIDAELAERTERGRWWRSTAAPPLLTATATLLAAAATALGTWASGMWGDK